MFAHGSKVRSWLSLRNYYSCFDHVLCARVGHISELYGHLELNNYPSESERRESMNLRGNRTIHLERNLILYTFTFDVAVTI